MAERRTDRWMGNNLPPHPLNHEHTYTHNVNTHAHTQTHTCTHTLSPRVGGGIPILEQNINIIINISINDHKTRILFIVCIWISTLLSKTLPHLSWQARPLKSANSPRPPFLGSPPLYIGFL